MTDKQKAFADEYLRLASLGCRSIQEAYKNISPQVKNDNSANAAGCRMLRIPEVAEYIAEREAEVMARMDEAAKEELTKNKLMVIQTLMSIISGKHIAEEVVQGGRIVEKTPGHKEIIDAIKIAVSILGMAQERKSIEVSAVADEQNSLQDILRQMQDE